MLNASNAVENQRVSICRLSSENRSLLVKGLAIAIYTGEKWAEEDERNRTPLIEELVKLETQLQESTEIWLIES
jgi:hypothetical protein